ncbi:MAG: BrnT family toxin [Thermodesulfobacteriota bacterium]|nr:BrnT family toxin [Thermodesulfobacteriota bacterium]
MKYEWDEGKSKINQDKHGIDFETANNLWLDEDRVEIYAPYPIEDRSIIIAKYHHKLWAAIYTIRDDTIRIISVRRARKREVNLYEKESVGKKQ